MDFKSVLGTVSIDATQKSVSGSALYHFDVLKEVDTIFIDAVNMTFESVRINNQSVVSKTTNTKLLLFAGFKTGKNTLSFTFKASPKQTLYFIGNAENLQIWTQGQGKNTSHWFPSFNDVNEKLIFGLDVTFDKKFQVISNGVLTKTSINNNDKIWTFRMQKPMSSYLLMLAMGNFQKRTEKSKSGLILENYIDKNDMLKYESTYQNSTKIFNFLESEIGFKYPWQNYKQVPVRDFLYAGMENTSATIFSQDFVLDHIGINDKSYCNVNAHELAHQWFGNLVTAKSGKHHWLQEGFATYYALLAEQHLYGNEHFAWKLYEIAENLQQASKNDSIPILNEKASSLTFYQKGAWALHYLKTMIGDQKFKLAVKNYLKKHQYQNVETDDFLNEVQKVSNFNTEDFKKLWLENPGFPYQEATKILLKNDVIIRYAEIINHRDKPFEEKKKLFLEKIQSNEFYALKREIIQQLQNVPFNQKKQLITVALQSKDLMMRQSVAETLDDFDDDFYETYRTLLDDKSYITQEIAMSKLWTKFPDKRIELLEKSKNWIGLNDLNLRILWLNLALRTQAYQNNEKTTYYDELIQYTSSEYEMGVRQNAFRSLWFLDKNDTNSIPNLVNGLTSHRWQMVRFSREKIRKMIKEENYRIYFENLQPKLSDVEKILLRKLLNTKL